MRIEDPAPDVDGRATPIDARAGIGNQGGDRVGEDAWEDGLRAALKNRRAATKIITSLSRKDDAGGGGMESAAVERDAWVGVSRAPLDDDHASRNDGHASPDDGHASESNEAGCEDDTRASGRAERASAGNHRAPRVEARAWVENHRALRAEARAWVENHRASRAEARAWGVNRHAARRNVDDQRDAVDAMSLVEVSRRLRD